MCLYGDRALTLSLKTARNRYWGSDSPAMNFPPILNGSWLTWILQQYSGIHLGVSVDIFVLYSLTFPHVNNCLFSEWLYLTSLGCCWVLICYSASLGPLSSSSFIFSPDTFHVSHGVGCLQWPVLHKYSKQGFRGLKITNSQFIIIFTNVETGSSEGASSVVHDVHLLPDSLQPPIHTFIWINLHVGFLVSFLILW